MNDCEVFSAALIGSAVVFLAHKIEDRFTDDPGKSCQEDHPHAWQCKFPGQIVSHKPWSKGVGASVCIIYIIIAVMVIGGVRRMAMNVATGPRGISASLVGIVVFSLIWTAWGAFETHHMKKTIKRLIEKKKTKRGIYFSRMFTQYIFFLYVPVTVWFLIRHGRI